MVSASFHTKHESGAATCNLCPHRCSIKPGETGICHTRRNNHGVLEALNYGILSAISSDPIEKKPLYHYFPGRPILSIGSYGCNLSCKFCQNCSISQIEELEWSDKRHYPPASIIRQALQSPGNIGLAYTYNEPTVFYEYMIECAKLAHLEGIKNVVVSNGYIEQAPLLQLIDYTDAFNIDLKSFDTNFYREVTGSRLKPVLRTIETIAGSGKHLELTFLVIPNLNDDVHTFTAMLDWIVDHCNTKVVLHISRYHPHYKIQTPATPIELIEEFTKMANERLPYVYPGNTGDRISSDTYCPGCGTLLVARSFYRTKVLSLNPNGVCGHCGHEIYGTFNS